MLSIFWDIIESLETFFETTTAGFIGLAFLIVTSVLILLLMKFYESK